MSWKEEPVEHLCRACGLPCPHNAKETVIVGTLYYHRKCWEAPGPKVRVEFPPEPSDTGGLK